MADTLAFIGIKDIAALCHEANRAYCKTIGDESQVPWAVAPEWQKQSAVNGVKHALENPGSTPADSHLSWLREKTEAGWKWGPVKDPEKKEHPCCVPYDLLPAEQRVKDAIFLAVVRGITADGWVPET